MSDMSKECNFPRKNDPKYVDLLDEINHLQDKSLYVYHLFHLKRY